MGLSPRDEDEHLAKLWQEHFGVPIPVHGAPSIARRVLLEHGAELPPPAFEGSAGPCRDPCAEATKGNTGKP